MKKVLTFGTFDLMHSGHFNIIWRLKNQFDEVYVAIVPDAEVGQYKEVNLAQNETERLNNVARLLIVKDAKVIGRDVEKRLAYIKQNGINAIAIGSDHANNPILLELAKRAEVEFVVLDRTDGISSTLIREQLQDKKN